MNLHVNGVSYREVARADDETLAGRLAMTCRHTSAVRRAAVEWLV
ncbi:hypothetical protein ABZ341_43490 [Streptomyces sp. NPDC006173]